MEKHLIITEKPSVARDICEVLGNFTDHGEYFESDQWIVTFAVGHLLELCEPEDYDKAWKGWTLASLPIIPSDYAVKPKEGQKKRLDVIKKLGQRADVVGLIDACDAGREGEVIFRRIIAYTGLDQKPHRRLWLQSMTADAIREGFSNLIASEKMQPLADAAWLRGVGDWLIGINATRALTKRLKGRKERGVWSAGRVQTPTLHILVDRESEILAHEPKAYQEITAHFTHGTQQWTGRYYDPAFERQEERELRPSRLFDPARTAEIVTLLASKPQALASETRRKSQQKPPLPFDLTTLQREANRRFSFSAKRTLNAAQRLYEGHKLLTYPRTDSRHLPSDYRPVLDETLASLGVDVGFREFVEQIGHDGPQNLDRILDSSKVSDHFAIIPTGAEPPADLSGDDARVYDLVTRQFLAALMGPATWAVVEREVLVGDRGKGQTASFRTNARTLEIAGFLAALGNEEGQGTDLPPLQPGEDKATDVRVSVDGHEVEAKETKPPSRLTEASLLRLMETAGEQIDEDEYAEAMEGRGLGTPATRADTIERLLATGYARRIGNKLGATPKAMRLMDVLVRANVPVLASPALTGEWEFELSEVQQAKRTREAMLDKLEQFTRDVTSQLTSYDYDVIYAGDPDLGVCPSCGQGRVIETLWGYRCTRNNAADDRACELILWKDRNGRYIDRKLATALVTHKHVSRVFGFVDRFGHELEGSITLEPDEAREGCQWQMRVDYGEGGAEDTEPEERGVVLWACPCGDPACEGVVETSKRYICQRLLDGLAKKGPVLPKVVCQRPVEVDEAAQYFGESAKTAFLESFISKRGRPFTGALVRKESGRHGFEFMPRAPRGKKVDDEQAAVEKPAAKAKKPASKAKAAAKKPAAKAKKPASKAKKPASKAKAAAQKPAAAAKKAAKPRAKKTEDLQES